MHRRKQIDTFPRSQRRHFPIISSKILQPFKQELWCKIKSNTPAITKQLWHYQKLGERGSEKREKESQKKKTLDKSKNLGPRRRRPETRTTEYAVCGTSGGGGLVVVRRVRRRESLSTAVRRVRCFSASLVGIRLRLVTQRIGRAQLKLKDLGNYRS